MKNLFFTIITFLFCIKAYSQQIGVQWQKSLGSSSVDIANCVQQTGDGGYIILGQTQNTNNGDVVGNNGNWDYWLVKLDNAGVIQWKKCFGGTTVDQGLSVRQTTDGGYILAGFSNSLDGDVSGNHSQNDYWIVKVDGTGIIQWQKSLGGSGADMAYEINQTSDGGYIVVGQSISNNFDVTGNHGLTDYWLVKLDGTGVIQWQKSLGGTNNDYGTSVQQTSDGGFIVAGYSISNNGDVSGNNGNFDYWIVRLTAGGAIQWQKCFGGSGDDKAYQIRQTTDGGYIIAGQSNSLDSNVTNNNGGYDMWVVKINSFGTLIWQKCLGGTGSDIGTTIQQTTDGGYVVAGYSNSSDGNIIGNQGANDCWIVKLDGSANILWQKSLGGSFDEIGRYIQQTSDGGYIVAGQSTSNNGDVFGNHGAEDYWVVKLDPATGIRENKNSEAIKVYPNPAAGKFLFTGLTTNIQDNYLIEIFDISGRSLLQVKASDNSVTVDISDFESGVYFYKISGSKSFSGKIIKN